MGFDLRRAGVNVDFAPVLDLAIFPANTVIGARSFGDDPSRVQEFAGAFAGGLRSQGVVPTFKHFPGHGSTAIDSHVDLPVIDLDAAVLRARDLAPYAGLLPSAEAIMTAHVVVSALDRERPATTSPRILTQLLRDELGFRGVCFTDCVQMDAIAKGIGSALAAVQALRAGADCVLVSRSLDIAAQSIDLIEAAVQGGHLPRVRLQEAFERVTALRASLQSPLALEADAPHPGIGREIGRRAVTVLRGQARLDPARSVVVSFEGATIEGVQGAHTDHVRLQAPAALAQFTLALEPQLAQVQAAIARIRGLGKRPIVLMRRAHIYAKQSAAVERLLQAFPDAMLVSVREPYDALAFPAARAVLCTYGDDAPSMEGLSDVLFGRYPTVGRFPLGGGVHALQGSA